MEGPYTSIVFSSELRDLAAHNSSFDKGVLRVCYTGPNKNGSCISKETFEACIKSIYNCPVVCNYDRDTDTIGAHDVELVRTGDGGLKMVNVTQPVGVVPNGANYWWEDIDDGDVTHEYLCTEILLWKRQEAYEKIRRDGVTAESMEIKILASHLENDLLCVDRFEFTAFCLLGTARPCFESASVSLFALDEFKAQMTEMMDDLRASFNLVQPEEVDIDTHTEGGKSVLEDEIEVQTEEFADPAPVADVPAEEPAAEVFEEEQPDAPVDTAEDAEEPSADADFALEGQFRTQLIEAVEAETVVSECGGQWPRYWFVDYDAELGEVYATDTEDWRLYGFAYSMNGDNVIVDFASKARKKWAIADYDEGSVEQTFAGFGEHFSAAYTDARSGWDAERTALNDELETLRAFKDNTEAAAVFAQFTCLAGIDAFEELCQNYAGLTKDQLEEKCYAIKGRYGTADTKFSAKPETIRLAVETPPEDDNEPYGGLFKK